MSLHVGHKHLQVVCPFREVCPHASSPNFLITNLLITSHPAKPLTTAHESIYHPRKGITRSTVQSSAHRGNFPSPVSFRDGPARGCCAAAVPSRVVPPYQAEPPVNEEEKTLLSVDPRKLLMGPLRSLGEKRQWSRTRDHGHLGPFLKLCLERDC